MDSFKAYRIFEDQGKARGRVVEMTLDQLDLGEVVVKTAYSSVNFKDALAGTGAGRIVSRYPCVGGCDSSGTVLTSDDPRYRAGDAVICCGYDLARSHDGGYAEIMRVPADWIVPLPQGLSLFEAMAIGTAGYTAALSIQLLEHNGMEPGKGKVVVNGATGGCASLAIDMLAQRGYQVTAVTGKAERHGYLRKIGAAEVMGREALQASNRPLEKGVWAAAFDSVGGEQLAALTRSMQQHGVIASFGNAGGIELHTTVLPFILRGVRLIGVDSAYTAMDTRRRVWQRLATDLRPRYLAEMAHTVAMEDLQVTFEKMLDQKTFGRTVVKVNQSLNQV